MNFLDYAHEKRVLIETHLRAFLKKKNNTLSPIFAEQNIIGNIEEFVLRGKLLRGTLFMFTVEMLGKKIDEEVLNIAIAIEIAHSSLLIHDDIIDNDEIRRGKMSFHALYSKRGVRIKAIDARHYGTSIAMVAGDVGFFLAMELISKTKKIPMGRLLNFYSTELLKVGFAEAVDSEFGQTGKEILKEEIYEVYRLKTARYTFSLPMVMGGIVSNAESKTIDLLDKLGEKAGIVFQIKDDEIGLFGNEKSIGKPVGSDVRENKKTLIRALLFESVNKDEKKVLGKYFGKHDLTKKELDYVIILCEKYNIRVKIQEEMSKIMSQVWEDFKSIMIEEKYKKMLKEFLEFNVSRSA